MYGVWIGCHALLIICTHWSLLDSELQPYIQHISLILMAVLRMSLHNIRRLVLSVETLHKHKVSGYSFYQFLRLDMKHHGFTRQSQNTVVTNQKGKTMDLVVSCFMGWSLQPKTRLVMVKIWSIYTWTSRPRSSATKGQTGNLIDGPISPGSLSKSTLLQVRLF